MSEEKTPSKASQYWNSMGSNGQTNGFNMMSGIGNAVGKASGFVEAFAGRQSANSTDSLSDQIYDSATSAAMQFPPWGTLIGGALKGIKATGGLNASSEGLGRGNDIGNTAMKFLMPGAGFFVGKTDKYTKNQDAFATNGFAGLNNTSDKVSKNAGAKLLFGRGLANEQTRNQKQQELLAANITNQNTDLKDSLGLSIQDNQTASYLKRQGGPEFRSMKKGGTFELIQAREILSKNGKPVIIGEDVSIIPDGALHAHKNHLDQHDKKLSEAITHKGIPVVTFDNGGEIEQHAEIERGEIIFREDISKRLEELWKDGSEKAMIEAGKMIADEIVNNTKDNSGEYEIKN